MRSSGRPWACAGCILWYPPTRKGESIGRSQDSCRCTQGLQHVQSLDAGSFGAVEESHTALEEKRGEKRRGRQPDSAFILTQVFRTGGGSARLLIAACFTCSHMRMRTAQARLKSVSLNQPNHYVRVGEQAALDGQS